MGAVNDPLVDLVTVLRESVLAVDPFDFFAIEAQDEDTVGFEFQLGVVLLYPTILHPVMPLTKELLL